MASSQGNSPQGIKSIEVGASVLFALEQERVPASLSEVARRSSLHPAKAHRYLASLVRTGLASQDANTGLYDLGPASRHLGIEALRRANPVSAATAHTLELRDATGHTTNVSVWSEAGPTQVRWDAGSHAMPIIVRVGSILPLLDSAVGHVFVTHLPENMTIDVMKEQQRQGSTGTMSRTELNTLKRSVQRDGFASTKNQMIFGLSALAAPVFGADGELELVLGMVLPSSMVSARENKRLGRALRASADSTSQELGLRPA